MIIDNALSNFVEKYDKRSMEFVENVSQNYAMTINKYTLPLFNIQESFDRFQEYIKSYASYKTENVNNEKSAPQDTINEAVTKFIDNHIFTKENVLYGDLPKFIESYLEGVQSLKKTVEEVKTNMMEAGMENEIVGSINEFTDHFMKKLHESFDPAMDRILGASGYNTAIRLENAGKIPKQTVDFL